MFDYEKGFMIFPLYAQHILTYNGNSIEQPSMLKIHCLYEKCKYYFQICFKSFITFIISSYNIFVCNDNKLQFDLHNYILHLHNDLLFTQIVKGVRHLRTVLC